MSSLMSRTWTNGRSHCHVGRPVSAFLYRKLGQRAFSAVATLASAFAFHAEVVFRLREWACSPQVRARRVLVQEATVLLDLPLVFAEEPLRHRFLRIAFRLSFDGVASGGRDTPRSAFRCIEVGDGLEEVVDKIQQFAMTFIQQVPTSPCVHWKSNVHVALEGGR